MFTLFGLTFLPFRQVGNAGMKAHIKAAHLGLFEETEAGVEAANTTLVLEAQDKKDETVLEKGLEKGLHLHLDPHLHLHLHARCNLTA